jgi:acyl-ACP thioesterase
MWAERRTSMSRPGQAESDVETVTLWVHLDPESWRPVPLSEEEATLYGESADGRRVTARLRHPHPDGEEDRSVWGFRSTELDIAGHINNAAYWQPLEQELLGGPEPERLDAEVEFRTPCQPGEKLLLRGDRHRWIVSEQGETHASILLAEIDLTD